MARGLTRLARLYARAAVEWLRFEAELEDGRKLTRDLFDRLLGEEVDQLSGKVEHLIEAEGLFAGLVTSDDLEEFLTLPAYERLE